LEGKTETQIYIWRQQERGKKKDCEKKIQKQFRKEGNLTDRESFISSTEEMRNEK
jgi:hypothetical protein